MRTLAQLLDASPDPSRPLLTYYDMSTGERVELSTTTTANWVAKTSNFLVDDLEAGPGTRIRIGLPSHWLRFVWLLSAWNVGATVVDHAADIGVSGPELEATEPVRLAASMRPFGARFTTPPAGFVDLGAEVPGHGDHFEAFDPPLPTTVALDLDGVAMTHADVLAAGRGTELRLLLTPVAVSEDLATLADVCLGAGSIVQVVHGTADDLARIADQEHATVREPCGPSTRLREDPSPGATRATKDSDEPR